jgi:hypothetical protein
MAAEAFAALNRMLESRERRESADRQMALAKMQFDYQKRQTEIDRTGKQLELLQGANTQMMSTLAEQFMSTSGLGIHYRDDDEGEGIKDAVEELGRYLPETEAARVASAIWAHYAGNPGPILRVGSDLKAIMETDESLLNANQKKFYAAFREKSSLFTNPESAKELLASTEKVIQNQSAIMSEVYEYGTGDFDIQRKDIGLYQPSDVDVDITPDPDVVTPVSVPSPAQLVAESKQLVKTTEEDYSDKQRSLNLLDTESISLRELQRKGSLTEQQREYMARIPQIKMDLEKDLSDLTQSIQKAKAEVTRTRRAEGEARLGRLSKLMEESPDYLSY